MEKKSMWTSLLGLFGFYYLMRQIVDDTFVLNIVFSIIFIAFGIYFSRLNKDQVMIPLFLTFLGAFYSVKIIEIEGDYDLIINIVSGVIFLVFGIYFTKLIISKRNKNIS